LGNNLRPPAHSASLAVLQKPEIEGDKHQDNTDVHDQPFPESIPEEQEIYSYNNGYQQ
jgi:hypothetical protein